MGDNSNRKYFLKNVCENTPCIGLLLMLRFIMQEYNQCFILFLHVYRFYGGVVQKEGKSGRTIT